MDALRKRRFQKTSVCFEMISAFWIDGWLMEAQDSYFPYMTFMPSLEKQNNLLGEEATDDLVASIRHDVYVQNMIGFQWTAVCILLLLIYLCIHAVAERL